MYSVATIENKNKTALQKRSERMQGREGRRKTEEGRKEGDAGRDVFFAFSILFSKLGKIFSTHTWVAY